MSKLNLHMYMQYADNREREGGREGGRERESVGHVQIPLYLIFNCATPLLYWTDTLVPVRGMVSVSEQVI